MYMLGLIAAESPTEAWSLPQYLDCCCVMERRGFVQLTIFSLEGKTGWRENLPRGTISCQYKVLFWERIHLDSQDSRRFPSLAFFSIHSGRSRLAALVSKKQDLEVTPTSVSSRDGNL